MADSLDIGCEYFGAGGPMLVLTSGPAAADLEGCEFFGSGGPVVGFRDESSVAPTTTKDVVNATVVC